MSKKQEKNMDKKNLEKACRNVEKTLEPHLPHLGRAFELLQDLPELTKQRWKKKLLAVRNDIVLELDTTEKLAGFIASYLLGEEDSGDEDGQEHEEPTPPNILEKV